MDEIIPSAARAANLAQISLKDAEPFLQIYLLKMFTIITKLCQLILYITAQNADVRELDQLGKKGCRLAGSGNSGPVEIRDKYREIKGWDIGYRIEDIQECRLCPICAAGIGRPFGRANGS